MGIKKYIVLSGLLIHMTVLLGCGQFLNAAVGSPMVPEESNFTGYTSYYEEITQIDRKTDSGDLTVIDLENLKEGMGTDSYTYEEDILTIRKAGDYGLVGKNDGCRIIINVYDDEIVHLLLMGMELNAAEKPAIYVEKAGKVILTAKEGTVNTISDSPEYADDKEACIFSNTDLTINGQGELNVYGYYHDAIRSKDRVKIVETNLYVRAKNDGIRGNDGVLLVDSDVVVESEKTGILAEAEQDFVIMKGGSYKVTSGENAVSAFNYVSIRECSHDLYAVKEAVKCGGVKEIDEGQAQ